MANELGRDSRFEMLKFLIDTLEGNGNSQMHLVIGRLDMRSLSADDKTHEIDESREQKRAGISGSRGVEKELIEVGCAQGMLDDGTGDDAGGTLLDKLIKA